MYFHLIPSPHSHISETFLLSTSSSFSFLFFKLTELGLLAWGYVLEHGQLNSGFAPEEK